MNKNERELKLALYIGTSILKTLFRCALELKHSSPYEADKHTAVTTIETELNNCSDKILRKVQEHNKGE